MIEPTAASISDLRDAMGAGHLSARDVVAAHLARAAGLNDRFGAYVALDEAGALQQAARLDATRSSGQSLGPLHGIPVAVKDSFDVAGLPTRLGSKLFATAAAAERDCRVVERLRQAGAVIVGKTAMHEMAAGFTTPSCTNPWQARRSAGGSSGGSAVAVAARLAVAALGTDSLGSTRVPAAFCGVVGLKPTYGSLSTEGVQPLSWSLDHVGVLARSAADTEALFDALADRAAAPQRPLTIGLLNQALPYVDEETSAVVTEVVATLTDHGATVREIEISGWEHAVPSAYALLMAEAAAAYRHLLGPEEAIDDRGIRTVLDAGMTLPAVTYLTAQGMRKVLRENVKQLFREEGLAALLGPVVPGEAPLLAQPEWPTGEPMAIGCARLNAMFNLTGQPSLTVPVALSAAGLPLAVQVASRPGDEATLFRLARILEGHASNQLSMGPHV